MADNHDVTASRDSLEPRPPDERCAGSGGYPAESVILDTIPGMNPSGTCPICQRRFTLTPWRLPEHERRDGR